MPRKGSAFAGLSVAIVTPFKGGQLDVKLLREQIEFQIAAGTQCLCPVGTTGESPTLSHEEHERVISEVVQAAGGRIKVIAGTGSKDRKSTRLNSSHVEISYAVFCLKKKNRVIEIPITRLPHHAIAES